MYLDLRLNNLKMCIRDRVIKEIEYYLSKNKVYPNVYIGYSRKAFFGKEDKEFYSPKLSSYALNICECVNIEEEIKYCIKNNKVDSEASKELKLSLIHI